MRNSGVSSLRSNSHNLEMIQIYFYTYILSVVNKTYFEVYLLSAALHQSSEKVSEQALCCSPWLPVVLQNEWG